MIRYASSYGKGDYAAAEGHVLYTPRGLGAGPAKRPVLWLHQHTGNALATRATGGPATYGIEALVDAGFTVMAADVGGVSTWGNQTAIDRTVDAVTWLLARPGVKTDKVLMWAGSMGTLSALNAARDARLAGKVAAITAALPVVNLQDVHDNRSLGGTVYGPIIDTAYGGTAAYTAALAAKNPSANAAALASIPMKLWYSDDDPVAVPAQVSSFATASGAQKASYGAQGHTFTGLPFNAVVAFLNQYSG